MFGTRSRVRAATRLATDGERTGPASRKKIQSNLVVLVPGPRPVGLPNLVGELSLMCKQEQKKQQKVPAVPKPRPGESPHISNLRPIGPRELVLEWLEDLPTDQPQRGDSQTVSQPPERPSAMAPSRATMSLLAARMGNDQLSTIQSTESHLALTQQPGYRETLWHNGIDIMPSEEDLPEHISQMLKDILPEESLQVCILDQRKYHKRRNMAIEGTQEIGVGRLLWNESLSKATEDRHDLRQGEGQLLERSRVPTKKPTDRVSTPKPDYHLGYRPETFRGYNMDVVKRLENSGIEFPFLDIEYKGDGRNSEGRLWVATNQCLGGTATFLNILDHFKAQLNQIGLSTQSEAIEPIVFGAVTNGTEARLFVSFSDGKGKFKMFLIRGFLLYEDLGFEKLDAYLTKIIEWGADSRLGKIKNALKALSDSVEPSQMASDGLDNSGGEEEESPPTPAPQAANTAPGRPPENGEGGQPVQARGRGRLRRKRDQEQVRGKDGRPPKRLRPT